MSALMSNAKPKFLLCILVIALSFEIPTGVLGNGLLPGPVGELAGSISGLSNQLLNPVNNALASAISPVTTTLGGSNTGGLLGNTIKMATGSLTGLTSGLASASSFGGFASPAADALVSSTGLANGLTNKIAGALTGAAIGASPAAASAGIEGAIKSEGLGLQGAGSSAALAGAHALLAEGPSHQLINAPGLLPAASGFHNPLLGLIGRQASMGASSSAGSFGSHQVPSYNLLDSMGSMQAGSAAAQVASATNSLSENTRSIRAVNGASAAQALETEIATANNPANQILNRQALASEAFANAQGESALAGADMIAHGSNNALSASRASNAFRQAKLATARDRVNVAGTIQNSARISDAAIATHDAATKAEDSLLGSELAVDSAGTVLDSDAAYIPPVTSSLLRSLPYGRLGLRNIIPKPLTYPSTLLPDVWLNGQAVNYQNLPLRQLIPGYNVASMASGSSLSNAQLSNDYLHINQPLVSNNGFLFSNLVMDPYLAYLTTGVYGAIDSSILPVLANGQLEAQDEIAMAHLINSRLASGAGSATTYHGFGRLNTVPLLTGSVSDANLAPTTTIGTTYPIGSALVIEPRDSYFQDYIDNASSRQNFDERQQ